MNVDIIRLQIEGQLDQEDDLWRIGRKSTWADLIIIAFYDYQRTSDNIYLLRIICNCIRIKLLENIGAKNITSDLTEYEKTASDNETRSMLIHNYFKNLVALSVSSDIDYAYELNQKIQYLKVLNRQLELDEYPIALYDELAITTIKFLAERS
ncbi:hypothetical protein [Mucilaginibacter segetis]|uniref:Uncharacterized protein n=1 Tax=Mucilaginibacter segetis TaxID=2793071 RepID=A0A934PUH5_9SPHI|nr:hypothetical protein [Mucilaginibacter segetis]MBK0379325.1 hypothetical protein [Mucilaginibacter segetis]